MSVEKSDEKKEEAESDANMKKLEGHWVLDKDMKLQEVF